MAERIKVVDFESPPIMEVVFGVMFAPLRRLQAAHLGRIWAKWADEYPTCQDVPPLPPVIEDLGGPSRMTVMLSNLPELPRVWLMSADSRTTVQIQRDRVHVNRRRLAATDPYEGFSEAQPRFERLWGDFTAFALQLGETPTVAQLELTYVNLIPACAIFSRMDQIGAVLPDFTWRPGQHEKSGEPDVVEWTTSFRLPEAFGRLHVSARAHAPLADEPFGLTLELTARGRPRDGSAAARAEWFDMARTAIDHGFIEMTSDRMQREVWKRVL